MIYRTRSYCLLDTKESYRNTRADMIETINEDEEKATRGIDQSAGYM